MICEGLRELPSICAIEFVALEIQKSLVDQPKVLLPQILEVDWTLNIAFSGSVGVTLSCGKVLMWAAGLSAARLTAVMLLGLRLSCGNLK